VIKLSVVRLLLEESNDCVKDRVDIYNGWTVDEGESIVRLCGTSLPAQPYLTDTNIVVVSFMSDKSGADGGFRIDYEPQIPGSDLLDSSSDNSQSKFRRTHYFSFRQLSILSIRQN